ncbi:MAG: hypothetical protein Q7V62_01630, partial [Actinomycetota bacterium]|nr:hypothetical protein [Actinomycetota bacterium]
GTTDRVVSYSGGSGTDTLTFSYVVGAGETASDLNYFDTSSLALNGGAIRDLAGNNAVLALPALNDANSLAGQKALVIDAAPVDSFPGTLQSAQVGVPLVFSAANSNLVSVSDIDSSTLTVTLSATNGTLSLSGSTGLTFSLGDGTADATMTFTGTAANVNAALDGMSFTGTAVAGGSIAITSRDGQTSVNGVTVQDSDLISVDVTAAVSPVLGGGGATRTYAENGPPVAINPVITVTDPDSATLGSATVSLGASFVAGDVLSFVADTSTMGSSFSAAYDGNGTLTLTSAGATATQAQWQAALAVVGYSTTSDAPVTTPRAVSFVVRDASSNASNAVTTTVNVSPVNDAPVISDASRTVSAIENSRIPVGAVGTLVSDAAFTGGISDPDGGGALKGIALVGSNEASGSWYYTTDGGSTWVAVGAVDATQALLLSNDAQTRLYFKPAPDFYGTAAGTLTVRAWDQTSGAAGNKVALGTTGGTSAFSSATDVIDVSVAANSAPVLDPLSTLGISISAQSGVPVGQVGSLVGVFAGSNISDSDPGALKGIALVESDQADGTWYYSTDDGANWAT